MVKYQKMPSKPWHALGIEEVFRNLNSNEEGLNREEAGSRLKKFGQNKIVEKNGEKIILILWDQFRNPLIYILIIASGVSFLLKDLLDSAIIAAAVVINVAVGFFQELKVSNILKELKKAISYRANVIRDGQSKQIDSKDVTLGDVLVLRQGDKIPADARIIRLTNFRTNEAALTGESTPVEKAVKILDENTAVADRQNLVFMGTFVEEGFAEAMVVNIGSSTEFGKIAFLIKEGRGEDVTPLQQKLALLAKQLGVFFLLISAGLFTVGVLSGVSVLSMFLTAVAVAVAAVPEGLPVALSVTLAIGAQRILGKGGLVRKIVAAEALGSTTVIAADKTSTLTEGKMNITQLFTSEGKDVLRENFPEVIRRDEMATEYLALKLSALLSDAFIENPQDEEKDWKVYGRPIDKAILLTLTRSGLERRAIEKEMPRLDELPFNAVYKYSAALNKFGEDKNVISVLGAPEVLLGLSNYEEKEKVHSKITELARQGLRILAIGFKFVDPSQRSLNRADLKGLNFLSLIVFSDPIREEVKEAMTRSRSAGLRTIVVTGDHLLTAEYVAKELGILTKEGRAIEGKDLPANLSEAVVNYDVFARVTPEDKVRIVDALKEKGELVAVIGDGINDAPALLRSDIGVAVGSGTDVAKEASDLVLLNDSFAIIVEAIKQGRIILDNIRKVVVFVISGAFSEVILISGSIIMGLPLALLPAQILWVNLIEDGLPSVALAFEKGENVMARRPEKKENIFTRDTKKLIVIFAIVTDLALFALFYYSLQATNNIDYARTMAFVGLGLTSLLYVFSVKSLRLPVWRINPFSNSMLNFGVLIGLALYIVAIYSELLRNVLGIVSLSPNDWFILVALGLFNIAVIELGKFIFFNRKRK
ncbi:MAG TPA: HAD-IC family P-type ATPase [Candidatus Paceibacterota bacterium]|nr:HAD-IC family P-type ATPase [Candidatus Paceibacterota bacterium]